MQAASEGTLDFGEGSGLVCTLRIQVSSQRHLAVKITEFALWN